MSTLNQRFVRIFTNLVKLIAMFPIWLVVEAWDSGVVFWMMYYSAIGFVFYLVLRSCI